MREARWFFAPAGAVIACTPPGPTGGSPVRAVPAAAVLTSCDLERRQAEAHRDAGFWLRAAEELEVVLARCPRQRPENEAALVDLVIGLEDAASAERLLANLAEPSRARLDAWVATWRAKQTSAPVAIASELRAVRAARVQRAPNALELAEAALARSGGRGELLAEVGSLRLGAQGQREAQPYFDRARVALQRETGRRPTAFVLEDTLRTFDDAAWAPDAREMWLWGRGGLDGFAPERASSPYASIAVVFDTESWEAVWRLGAQARSCPSLPLANGAGFARCDGLFARDGRRLLVVRA